MKFLGNCRVLVSSEGRGEWNFVAAAKVKRPATRSGNISKRWNGEEIVNYTLYYLGKRRHRLEQTSIKISDLRRGGIRIIMAGYKWNRRDKSRVIIYYYFSIFPPFERNAMLNNDRQKRMIIFVRRKAPENNVRLSTICREMGFPVPECTLWLVMTQVITTERCDDAVP